MITLKTSGPSDLASVLKQSDILSADFATEHYRLGALSASFTDLFDHTRASAMRYYHPERREWVTAEIDQPLLYAPDGQRGLCLAGCLLTVISGNPTAAGTASVAYASSHNGKVLPLTVYGPEGAEAIVTGAVEIVGPGDGVSRPFAPAFYRLTGGSLTVAFNNKVTAYRMPQQGWDEWPAAANLYSQAVGPTVGLSAAALAAVNAAGPIVEFSGLYVPHASRFPLAQTNQWALRLSDGVSGFGFRLDTAVNTWVLQTPRNSEILRPNSKTSAARPLDFRLVWDKSRNLADMWAGGRLVNEGAELPDFGQLTAITLGKHDGSADLRGSIKRFAARTSVSGRWPPLST